MSEPNPQIGLTADDPPDAKPDITNVPWGPPDAMLGIILLIPASVLAGLVLYAVGVAVFALAGSRPPQYLQIAALAGSTCLAGIGLAWWLGAKRQGGAPANFGVTKMKPWFDLPIAFLGEIIIFVAMATYGFILLKLGGLELPEQPVMQLFGRSSFGFGMAVLFVAVLAPIGEEVFFRGFVYTALRRRWGVGLGIVMSSVIFALFHVVPLLYVPMFIIGAILAVVFEYRKSLAPNIILHGLNNLLALVVLYGRPG